MIHVNEIVQLVVFEFRHGGAEHASTTPYQIDGYASPKVALLHQDHPHGISIVP